MNRTKSTLINSATSIGIMIISYIAMFIYRTILIKVLGSEYVGITGLFGNVISLFSVAELGIGTAITIQLYKPLAERDREKISAFMNLFKKVYKAIGIIVLVLGILMMPFLDKIIGNNNEIEHMYLIYLLYLLNAVLSYSYFSYYQILITADRKDYKMFFSKSIIPVLISIFQVIVIIIFKQFILTIIVNIILTIIGNVWIYKIAKEIYPFLDEYKDKEVSKDEKKKVIEYVKATSYYKVAMNVLYSTDNIIISYFLGLTTLGLYSNYCLVINTVKAFILSVINPIGAAIGNLNVTSDKEHKKEILNILNLFNNWLCYFCVVCFFVLINPFIELWIGKEYLLDKAVLIIIIINFYTEFMPNFIVKYRNGCGLDIYGKYRPIITAVLNIIFSIAWAKSLGLTGILLGTLVSRLLTVFWFDPYIVYKKLFNEVPSEYFLEYVKNTVLTLFMCFLCSKIFNLVWNNSYISFIVGMFICITVPNIVFLLIYRRDKRLNYYVNLSKQMLKIS